MPNVDDMSPAEIAALLHFYQDAGINWLLEDQPVDRFAEFVARAQQPAAAEIIVPQASPSPAELQGRELPRKAPPQPAPSVVIPDDNAVAEALRIASEAKTIADLEAAFANFTGCNLRNTAKSTAFIDGDRQARVLVLGSVSSAEDDRDGLPFSGRNGDLLDKMLGAIGLSRQTVLLSNVIPWRPPGNRAPSKPEMDICRPFVERLIALAKPDSALILGNFAARFFTDSKESIHALRGRWLDIEAGPVRAMATFHPQDILQAPLNKPLVWRDLLSFRNGIVAAAR